MDKQIKALASVAVAVAMLIGAHKLLWAIDADLLRTIIETYLVVVTGVGIYLFVWSGTLGEDSKP